MKYIYTEADPEISIWRGGFKKKIGFQSNWFLENQKIPGRNRKIQNMVKRKMTRTKLEIFLSKHVLIRL